MYRIHRIISELEHSCNYEFDDRRQAFIRINDIKLNLIRVIDRNEFDILKHNARYVVQVSLKDPRYSLFKDSNHNPICVMLYGWTLEGDDVNRAKDWQEYYDLRQIQEKG